MQGGFGIGPMPDFASALCFRPAQSPEGFGDFLFIV